jgi:hypothetical protein
VHRHLQPAGSGLLPKPTVHLPRVAPVSHRRVAGSGLLRRKGTVPQVALRPRTVSRRKATHPRRDTALLLQPIKVAHPWFTRAARAAQPARRETR